MKIEKLNENKILNEAFSPSMPNWLKQQLQYEMTFSQMNERNRHPRRNFNNEYAAIRNGAPYYVGKPGQSNARVADDSSYNLWSAMLANNININSGKFVEDGDLPTSSRDPRLKEPNIPFFLLGDPDDRLRREVCAPSINYNAESITLPGGKSFKYYSMKQLLPNIKAFCYIDSSDPENHSENIEKGSERKALKKSLDPRYIRGEAGSPDPFAVWPEGNNKPVLDKSGFSKLMNARKYSQELKKSGDKRVAKKIDALYADLRTIYEQMPSVFANVPFDNFNYDMRRSIERAMDNIEDATSYYNNAAEALKNFVEGGRKNTNYIDQAEDRLNSANHYLNRAKNELDKYLPALVDWDTDDVIWEE